MTRLSIRTHLATAVALVLAGHGQAAIVEGADIGGFRTFVDTSTGTIWADVDNHLVATPTGFAFRFATYNDYRSALTAAGFTWAFWSEVNALMTSTPLATESQYTAFGNVMGSVSFGETTTISAYSNATDGLVGRQYGAVDYGAGTAHWASAPLLAAATVMPAGLNDAGLWAFFAGSGGGGGGSVPLPGTLALAGLGLCGLVARRRARA